MKRLRSDAGQSLVVVALSMVVLLGFLGLGLDLGYLRYMKRLVQRNSDAAAIAAAAELPQCGGTTQTGCAAMTTAAQSALTENGFSGATVSTGSCTPGSSAIAVIVNNPPQCVSTDPHLNDGDYVEVLVAHQIPLNFATVLGFRSLTVTTRSEAAMASDLIYALDPTDSGAVTVQSGTSVTSQGGVIDESASRSAFSCSNSSFTAPYIGVVGSSSGYHHRHYGDYNTCTYPQASPNSGIAVPVPADPLLAQQTSLKAGAPSTTQCGSGSGTTYTGSSGPITLQGNTYTLNPGTYCGGITIENGGYGYGYGHGYGNPTVVTFNPGIYTLTSTNGTNGGLVIDAGASVTGNGVGFYNYGPNGSISMICQTLCGGFGFGYGGQQGTIALTAPNATNCSGCATAWQGILFFQDPGNLTTATVVGSSTYNVVITGTSYFPKATVNYAMDNAATNVAYNLLVAYEVQLGNAGQFGNLNSNFYNNFYSLRNHRSPLQGTGGTGVVE